MAARCKPSYLSRDELMDSIAREHVPSGARSVATSSGKAMDAVESIERAVDDIIKKRNATKSP